jgi:hypothetical protein
VVVAVVEALEIDFVKVHPGPQILEYLRSAVAVRDESGKQAGGFGFFEDSYGPFTGNQRFVIGANQYLRALSKSVLNQSFRSGFEWRRNRAGIT